MEEPPLTDRATGAETVQTHRAREGVLRVVSTSVPRGEETAREEDWPAGFPYFGEAAETLDALDLWNRTSLQALLYRGSRRFLGDRIFCRLDKARWAAGRLLAATVEVLDPENGARHRLRYRAARPRNFA